MDVSSPSEQGVRSEGISAFLDVIEGDQRIEPHGLIIQRHGHRIVEGYWSPHTGDRSRLVYSLSKSFTGAALGLQIGEGRLSLDDLVSDHLPELFDDDTPDATRRMRIRHIASMSTGHDRETLREAATIDPVDPVHGFLSIPPDAEPGTLFAYNQPPVLTLATILQRLAGASMVDYLRPRILDPIGIGDLRWRQTKGGFDLGFSGVYTNLDAVARLGQLYLDDGVWNGRRLLPEGWVADASSAQVANPERGRAGLAAGIRLPTLDVTARLSRRRRLRPVHGRAARARRRDRDVLVHRAHADRPRRDVGTPPPRLRTTWVVPGQSSGG